MLSPLFEQNMTLLENRNSYMYPLLPRIIPLLNDLEKNTGANFFDAFERLELRKGEYLLREGSLASISGFSKEALPAYSIRKMAKK